MAPHKLVDSYLNNHYEGMDPKQLILLLYKGALDRLKLTMEGIDENNIKKRGENLSKVIAIVSELNASLDMTINDESTRFLRGLYTSMLMELPKVSLNNDVQILKQAEKYILRLKGIWEKDVMTKGHGKRNGSEQHPLPEDIKTTRNRAAFNSIAV